MKKFAIIAYNHPESTLPLSKYLIKEGCSVDYFFITGINYTGTSAFEFGYRTKYPCIKRMTNKHIKSMYDYFDSDYIKIYLVALPPTLQKFGVVISNIMQLFRIVFFYIFSIFLQLRKYEGINIVGQKNDLVYLYKFIKGIKIIHSLHEVLDYNTRKTMPGNFLINYLIKNKIQIVVHSLNTYNELKRYSLANPSCINIIPFGLFETYKIFEDNHKIQNSLLIEDYILFFGMISPYKGLKVLYQAMELVLKEIPKIKIIVAGNGFDPYIIKMGNNPSYKIINRFITNEEIVQLNRNAKFIVCPYLSASQSGIVQTTFLFDKPIIASNVGAFREIIIPNENGLLVEPDNPQSLAKAILLLYENPDYYNSLKKGVSNFTKNNRTFNWNVIAQQYKHLFESN